VQVKTYEEEIDKQKYVPQPKSFSSRCSRLLKYDNLFYTKK
jgi:hypothetical protein